MWTISLSHCVLNELSRCKFCKNGFFNTGREPFNQNSNRSDQEKWSTSKGGPVFSKLFRSDQTDPLSFGPKIPEILVEWIAPTFFSLSHACHFETRTSPLSKLGENAFGAQFLQFLCKNEYGDPHFLFHDFKKDSPSFRWQKNWHKSMFSFLAILLNCRDRAITGRIARVQFNSTLEHKVKTRALKGIFLVHKWINNILKSNSVRYSMHHRKNVSFLSSFGLWVVFVKRS